ncbi:MAG TPA: DUF5670 family protein [Gemmatimonadota bacterium]|nr:DUF5670 family protein [Gemmatimonadota bacterium]
MSPRGAVLPVLAVWAAGAALFPMNGMIHVLLVLVLVLLIVDRAGR